MLWLVDDMIGGKIGNDVQFMCVSDGNPCENLEFCSEDIDSCELFPFE